MTDLGEVARPRVRFEDVPADVRPILEGISGGHEEWGSSSDEFHPADWDLIVTFAKNATHRNSDHLHVLSFGATRASVKRSYRSEYGQGVSLRTFSHDQLTYSRSRYVPVELEPAPPSWRALLNRTIAEQLPEGAKHFWQASTTVGVTSLVIAGTGEPSGPAALLVERTTTPSGLLLLLPSETIDHGAWLVAFLEFLRGRDGSAFPAPPDWRRSREWAPVALRSALDASQALNEERKRLIAEFDCRHEELMQVVRRELDTANLGQQRLIAAQGDDLVAAVAQALRSLGFEVRDMDAELPAGQPKLEDLRITDASVVGWELLAEVKGYSKGAKASDVQQILQRPMWAYIEEKGRRPGGIWHIVNAWAEAHPSSRPVALQGDPSLLQLSAADGALIDTRDLFLAVRAVEGGDLDASSVRDAMRTARERWQFHAGDVSREE